jgi:hypothetical protein
MVNAQCRMLNVEYSVDIRLITNARSSLARIQIKPDDDRDKSKNYFIKKKIYIFFKTEFIIIN